MKKIAPKSGETLVEVLAATAVFLLMMGIMQGAISFCTNAQHKSKAIRSINAEICENLRTTPPSTAGDTVEYSFNAISSDGNHVSSAPLFKVEATLGKKEVEYQDEAGSDKTVTFYLFQSATSVPSGGEGP